jgi:hypothetical protein
MMPDEFEDGKAGEQKTAGSSVAFTNTKSALLRHGPRRPLDCRNAFKVTRPEGWRWRKCGRPRCCRACRDQFAWRQCLCLRASFRILPPDFFCTFRSRSLTDGSSFSGAVRKLFRTLERLAGIKWYRIYEWRHGRIHGHALLRGRLTRRVLCLARESSRLWVSCKRVRSVAKVTPYIVKHTKRLDRKAELAPRSFRGRLHSASRGFLVRPFVALWREVKAERAAAKAEGRVSHG